MERGAWTVSSIPVDPAIDSLRGQLRWHNPNVRDQALIHDVYPYRDIDAQAPQTLQSLVLEFRPDSANPEHSWGGVMRYLGSAGHASTPFQYLAFALKLPANMGSNPDARLVVDLGQISEDALPNDTLDTEDKPLPGQTVGNGILSPEEDTGIDGKFGTDPADSAYWNGPTRPPIPSWDDWSYADGSSDYSHINGTEHNRNDQSYPNTEDLNGNNALDTLNNYFSFDIALNGSGPFVVGGNAANQWRYYSIPLQNTSVRRTVGNATLSDIPFARFYLTGISDVSRFTQVELVDIALTSER
jgi:hypothetical protein